MTSTKRLLILAALLASTNSVIAAQRMANCPDMPPRGVERDNLRDARMLAVDGKGTVFNNNEGLLPAAGRGEVYREYDLGGPRDGNNRGAHRAVLRVQEGKDRGRIQAQYYTQDHYRTFCIIQ